MATAEAPVYRCTVCHAVYTAGERFCPLDAGAIAPEDRHSDPRVGKTIDERYFVRRLVGRGGMGSVYEADHVGLDKRVAIKFLATNLTDRDSLARFRREAKVAGKIDHKNVVRIMDVGSADADTDFIVMEFLDGKDLSATLHDEGPMDPARVTSIIRKVLRGLKAIHAAGIVHRDIKPANVLLATRDDDEDDADKEDFVKIMDFGISKSMNNSDGLTHTGAIIGTPEYMAPEQLLGDPVDQRADLYATGLMAFRMLTGQMPFTTDKGFDRGAAANPYVEVPAISSLRPDVPAALSDALAKALEKEPEKRYPDAQAFLAALEGLGASRSASTKPVPWLVAPRRDSRVGITGTEQTVHAAAAADTAVAVPVSKPPETPSAPAAVPAATEQVRPKSRALVWAALGAIGLAAAAVVIVLAMRSQPPEPPPKPPVPPAGSSTAMGGPPPSGTPTGIKHKVDALKQKARAAEAAGKRDEAVQAYLDAYTLDPDAGTLYSIAELYEAMKDHAQDAIRYFKRYLHDAKNAPDRADVEKRIKQLEEWVAAQLKELGGTTKPHSGNAHAPVPVQTGAGSAGDEPRDDCLCLPADSGKYGTTSLCKKLGPIGCRCEADNSHLCPVPVNADGACPDPKYSELVSPGKPNAACTGYAINAVGGGAVQGKWSCTVCKGAPMREFKGFLNKGGACTGYVNDTGEKVEGRLDCAEDRWRRSNRR